MTSLMTGDLLRKKRILFIIDGLEFGGGERGFAQIIHGLPPEKYRLFIASSENGQFHRSLRNSKADFIATDFSKRLNFSLIPKLAKIIKESRIDIVHSQGARAEFYARVAKKYAKRPKYVSTIQMPVEGFDIAPLRKRAYSFLDRISERIVDRFIVVSNDLKERMIRQRGVPPAKVVKICNGVEIDRYVCDEGHGSRAGLRAEYGVDKQTLLIGAIGRLVWQKGFRYLVKALPDILKTALKTKILIVGDGPLRTGLEELAGKLGVQGHITFAGFRSDIKEILAAIDILVIPSLLEGFPMITLEGMAMAKPIIAARIQGIREQIRDGKSGILLPPKDSGAIADAVMRLARDRKHMEKLGIEARRSVVKEFSVRKMVAETEKVYQSLRV